MQQYRRIACAIGALLAIGVTTPAKAAYWSLFNEEGENARDSVYVEYATRLDMFNDTNRVAQYVPDGFFNFSRNVVGSGADIVPAVPPPSGQAVSEPAALGLFALGLAGLAAVRRRR